MRIFWTSLLCFAASPALADTLYLHNGDKFSGKIIEVADEGQLEFKAAFGQTLSIPWDTVAGLYNDAGEPVPFPVQEQSPVQQMAAVQPAPPAPLTAEAAKPTETPKVEEKTVEPKVFSGRVNFGASLQTGNTESEAINLDGTLKARWSDKHRSTLKAEMNLEEDDGDTTEDNRKIAATHDYYFARKWFIDTGLSFEQDDLDELDLRSVASLGLGHQPFEQDDLNLKYVLGPSYLREDFENGDVENSIAGRWALDYDQKIWQGILQLFHEHEFLVPADDTEDFLIDSKTGVRVPLKAGLVGTAEVDFEWDNKPEPGVKEDDTEYSVKIGYEW